MDAPLDDVEYLVGSRNRVEVLLALVDGRTDRRTLHEETAVSPATLGRILGGFRERGWATRTGHTYRVTRLGELLAEAFTSFVDTVETVRSLGELIEHLPVDEVDFELDRLGAATVTTPSPSDPIAPMHRATALTRDSEHVRFLTNGFASPIAEVLWRRTVHGDGTVVAVLTDRVVETIRSTPEARALTRETIESGRAEFYRYPGHQPYNVAVMDDELGVVMVVDDEANLRGAIETDDEVVRGWCRSTIETYRLESVPIDAGVFAD